MRSLEQVNIRTNVRTYVLTYIRTGQTLYPLHNCVVRGDNNILLIYSVVSFKQLGPHHFKLLYNGLFYLQMSIIYFILSSRLFANNVEPPPIY